MAKALPLKSVPYSYEEFADHLKAMPTVRQWDYTSRFGHVGNAQTSWANNARVIEYFCDSYQDQKEALRKAELFLSIHDYIGRNVGALSRKDLIEERDNNLLSIDSALLRAVHFIFTMAEHATTTDPKMVLDLAKTFKKLHANPLPQRQS